MELGSLCLLLSSCLLLLLLPSCSYSDSTNSSKTEEHRADKALSVFSVVKFPNTVCASSSNRNGTCYTASECSAKGGAVSGACASSFGVCCVFESSCTSGSIAENNTYFTSSAIAKGSNCRLKVCKCASNVCQLRLDFETFALNLPITGATSVTDVNGNAANPGAFTLGGTCHRDTFGVSSPGHTTIPTICGTNTGEHMYVPASDQCNVISANIGSTSTSTSDSFTIKITQIPCNSPVLPPTGCLQYFYGASSGTIQSFNYQGTSAGVAQSGKSQLLANQHYNACIRTERTYCGLCYWATTIATGFHMSVGNGLPAIGVFGWDTNCGTPGAGNAVAAGVAIEGISYDDGGAYDYVMIPGGNCHPATATTAITNQFPVDRYCGTNFDCRKNTNSIAGTPDGTVCTGVKPFKLSVHSDGVEYANPATTAEFIDPNNAGFNLNYYMKTNCILYDTSIAA